MFTIQHHGTSGTWYTVETVSHMYDALRVCEQYKSNGYGVRIVRQDGSVAMNAPWQEEIDWSVSR